MFYVEKDNKIIFCNEDYATLQKTLGYSSEYADLPILETDKEIISLPDGYAFSDDMQEEFETQREEKFKHQFFEIEGYGWFRKVPKGYSSAVEAMGAAFNMVSILGSLPANTLTFYNQPDFTDETQCTEEWLVENSFKNEELTVEEFGKLYAVFLQEWNSIEHKEI